MYLLVHKIIPKIFYLCLTFWIRYLIFVFVNLTIFCVFNILDNIFYSQFFVVQGSLGWPWTILELWSIVYLWFVICVFFSIILLLLFFSLFFIFIFYFLNIVNFILIIVVDVFCHCFYCFFGYLPL